MKEHPILFSTPMVQAILAGNKTMTRRVIKPQPFKSEHWFEWEGTRPKAKKNGGGISSTHESSLIENLTWHCPYGKPGDVLWVREKFFKDDDFGANRKEYVYAANIDEYILKYSKGIWKPSIHMPRRACRLFLKIKSIKVERLHSISEADAKAEGAEMLTNMHSDININAREPNYRTGFARIWIDINGLENYVTNPWVWVIEFEKINHK